MLKPLHGSNGCGRWLRPAFGRTNMAIAAVPSYLGEDFSTASPGLRFGMYLQLWGVDQKTQELLWGTHDLKYEVRGQYRQERVLKEENKASALKAAAKFTASDKQLMEQLLRRQQQAFAASAYANDSLVIEAQAVAPFTTGLGNEHPLENGFSFLNPYGLPYLPGSGVKGVLRQAARELVSGEWGASQGWDSDRITALFGLESKDGDSQHRRGALIFWDIIPQIKGDHLSVEVMTPHQKHYYQEGDNPHDSGQPIPLTFLTVPPGSDFTFHVQCNRALLKEYPDLLEDDQWHRLLP
ncbi:MAG: type III-B CRISPR module RAMP protein Cmr6, partial [Alcaligenaceae bacterium]|nr:type III-B CRISPR module RAMP protein Cmr6 [Alcaligenaceae bacterium]